MASFFQRLFISTGEDFANITLDASLSERFDLSSTITDHQIDTGGVISDHAFTNPQLYTLEGVVSDTPGSVVEAAQQIGQNALDLINSAGSLLGIETPAPSTKRSVAAFAGLVEYWQNLVTFDVQTAMGLRKNLIIQNLTTTVDRETANMLRFTAILRQLEIVETSIITSSNLLFGPINESGSSLISGGVKQSIASSTDTVAKALEFFG